MSDLLTVILLIGALVSLVSAKKYNKKVLYFVGGILLIGFIIVMATEFGTGFGIGMISPK
ncbi:hypothetical protein SAMN04487886_12234 [Clostridium sp. DSM 8431]|uniref:hypothetical protein n=1 Tax=Clostridium sp. DSM 8431 TaxID=1761781 RepID=UPI0008E7BEFF|nr:hypothetical protein [Clostridium sp. DSM 8431]SFU85213.1 hypothetical protein SAMN04487886_12234 [Clostridium sp. DSM 8431]